MKPNEQEPLHFYGSDYETAKTTIGKNKQINPMNLIPPQNVSKNQSNNQNANQFQGNFYNDHLRPEQSSVKSKRIIKLDKRTNYKTKMCPHGRECRHPITQLRKPFMKRTTPCTLYQAGQCQLGSACRNYHGNMDLKKKNYKYKVEICKDFLNGKCMLGPVCIHIHQLPPQMGKQEENQEEINDDLIQAVIQSKQNHQNTADDQEPAFGIIIKNAVKKQIIEVVEQVIGKQQIVEDGFSFTFNFSQ